MNVTHQRLEEIKLHNTSFYNIEKKELYYYFISEDTYIRRGAEELLAAVNGEVENVTIYVRGDDKDGDKYDPIFEKFLCYRALKKVKICPRYTRFSSILSCLNTHIYLEELHLTWAGIIGNVCLTSLIRNITHLPKLKIDGPLFIKGFEDLMYHIGETKKIREFTLDCNRGNDLSKIIPHLGLMLTKNTELKKLELGQFMEMSADEFDFLISCIIDSNISVFDISSIPYGDEIYSHIIRLIMDANREMDIKIRCYLYTEWIYGIADSLENHNSRITLSLRGDDASAEPVIDLMKKNNRIFITLDGMVSQDNWREITRLANNNRRINENINCRPILMNYVDVCVFFLCRRYIHTVMSPGLTVVLVVIILTIALFVLLAIAGKTRVTTNEIDVITADLTSGEMLADSDCDSFDIFLYKNNSITSDDAQGIKNSGSVNLAMVARKKDEAVDPGAVTVPGRDVSGRSFTAVKGKHTFGAYFIIEDGSKKTIFTPYRYDKDKNVTIGVSTNFMIMDVSRFGKYRYYIKIDANPDKDGKPQHSAFFEISHNEKNGYHLAIPTVAKEHVETTGDRWYVEKVRLYADGRFHKLSIVYF